MRNMWDLPEASYPVHGIKRKHVEHHEHEERSEEGFERVGKVITEGAVTVMGIGVMGALGAGLLGALKPK